MAGSVELTSTVNGSVTPTATGYQEEKRVAPPVKKAQSGSEADSEKAASDKKVEKRDMKDVAESLQNFATAMQRDLSFSVNDETGDVVIKVTNSDGDLVRSIPSEEVLRMKESLSSLTGLLFEDER